MLVFYFPLYSKLIETGGISSLFIRLLWFKEIVSSITHLVDESLPQRPGAWTAWCCSLQHICQIAAQDWSDQCKATSSLCQKSFWQTQDAEMFIGYLKWVLMLQLRLCTGNVRKIIVLCKNVTPPWKKKLIWFLCFKIMIVRGWKTLNIEY